MTTLLCVRCKRHVPRPVLREHLAMHQTTAWAWDAEEIRDWFVVPRDQRQGPDPAASPRPITFRQEASA